jgi:CRP-like cAMP-binding protein
VYQISRNSLGNRLIAALPREEYKRLWPHLEPVSLSYKKYLYQFNALIEHVYFPNSGVVSVLSVMEDGGTVEVATVGNEGMVGIPVLLGAACALAETLVQVPGDAVRMKVDVFKSQVIPGSPTHNLLLRYTQALMNQLSQSVACNRLHSVEQRCCRWLLQTRDRVESDEFPMTQEFFSQMLGVRRASVSEVAAILQKAGLIRYHRGKMTIINQKGLEAGSCECYQVIKQEYARLLSYPEYGIGQTNHSPDF